MATEKDTDREQGEQQGQQRIRAALNDAYAFVLSQQRKHSFSAYTFEDAMDAQIERIEGAGTDIRPNERERVIRTYTKVVAAAEDVEEHISPNVDEDERANTA